MTQAPPIRLLLIDDHPLVRDGLRARFDAAPNLQVVGEAGNAAEALARAKTSSPDLALMDISMRGTNGIELTALFREQFPHIAVLILSMHDNAEYVRQAVRAGARGYVLKDAPAHEIVTAIERVARGDAYYSAAIAARVVQASTSHAPIDSLTPREREILSRIARRLANKQIATELGLSEKTVKAHVTAIFKVLGVANRTQAALAARSVGVVFAS